MPTLRVYPDTFCRDINEEHHIPHGQSVHDWMLANVPDYDGTDRFTLTQGGEPYSKYHSVTDDVDLTLRPQDPGTIGITLAITTAFATVHTLYDFYRLSKAKTNDSNFESGSSIYDANVQGNQVRLFGVIPEIFGYHKVYPDIISAPWREYIQTNPTFVGIDSDQWLYLLLSVGVGEFDIDDLYIGNTPVSRYGADIDYQVFKPGEDVTGHLAHKNMYTSREVGQTSGSLGIQIENGGELWSTTDSGDVTWDFSGNTMTFHNAEVGTTIEPEVDQLIDVETGIGSNDGLYKIVTISNNSADDGKDMTVRRMIDESTEDPEFAGSPGTDFVTETGVGANVTVRSSTVGWKGPFLAVPESEVTNTVYLDIRLPSGLIKFDKDGDGHKFIQIDYEIEYRDANIAGDWTTVSGTIGPYKTNDEIAETIEISTGSPSITPEVRMRRTNDLGEGQLWVHDMFWVGLRAELQPASSYEDVTVIAVAVKGTNSIAGTAENQFNAILTRLIPEYEGGSPTWSSNRATREITSAFRYIANDMGLDDTELDMTELATLHTTLTGRGDTFDGVFDQPNTLFESLKSVLAPGYAVPVITGGQISMVRDESRSTYMAMYQPDNIIGGIQREYQLFDEDEPDGIRVEYFSSDSWRPETIDALLGDDVGAEPETIKAFGITDETRAWRLGMRKRRERRYRRKQFRFSTELDALNSQFGDYVSLADDIPNYSQTGRVIAVSGTTITLDRELNYESGSNLISFRKPDGTLSGPYVASVGSELDIVEIDSALDFTPVLDGSQEPPLFQFGTVTRWNEPALIAEILPKGTEGVDVVCTNYDERVYDSDDDSP